MKHTMQLTDKGGAIATLILCEVSSVGHDRDAVAWTIKDRPKPSMVEFATDDEARAAYDEINAGLEAWHARNDPPVLDPAGYLYEVLFDGFHAHGEVHKVGDVIEYDSGQAQFWGDYLESGDGAIATIKRVPK